MDSWPDTGEILVGSERMEYTVINRGSRIVSITSRGFAGTTAVSQSNGVTASIVDYPRVQNCIVDVINVYNIGAVINENITNSTYDIN
jgi:hypothetical protein